MFSQKSRRKWILLLSVIAIVGAILGVLRGPRTAIAGQNAGGEIWIHTGRGDQEIATRCAQGGFGCPVMVSILRDGALVRQQEGWLNAILGSGPLPVGLYEVRIEGEGMVTLVKRGINVTGGTMSVQAPMRAGQGVHIVEYATGALSREEIAGSLRRLEARIAKLEAK